MAGTTVEVDGNCIDCEFYSKVTERCGVDTLKMKIPLDKARILTCESFIKIQIRHGFIYD
jgi:hypothetical protein